MSNQPSGETEQVTRAFFEALNSMDKTDPLDFCSDDTRFEDTAFGVVVAGKQPYKGVFTKFFGSISGVKSEVKSVIASGDWAAAVWTFSGTQKGDFPGIPATGKSFSVRGVSIVQVKNGKMTSRIDYWDSATMLRQLGVIPSGVTKSAH
jgi:steroid delta-isomerase-like uncharacterized protein